MFFCFSLPRFSTQGRGKPPYLLSFTVGMATQSYVTELQAAPQASQPPQAPPQALPQPPPPAAPQPPAAATPQPQYVTELQSPQPQTQPPGSQKQYVAELPAAPAPSQPATPAPSPVAQQYIVVTVSGKFTSVLVARVLGTSLGGAWGAQHPGIRSRATCASESRHLWVKGLGPSRGASHPTGMLLCLSVPK